ncbi:lipoate--protein ligase family protein [Endomicrobium proavitum]|uniref:Lipoate-protein ligase A-like protein n=1 Tax=Endomicrobium proavitum TaxID=1408281 RepID=A0A0G3WHQ7_9BACT|nr:lipoate--protein ligase family protein [Endomicrobium proavitum]AKL97863.1 Lipoate-protein ligase A-like protein [Endomicrobium proavitum]
MLLFIKDKPRNAAMNMAIDEVIFDNLQDDAVLRIYLWDKAYTTIGYFQKNEAEATRRLTGGLLVNHKNDVSYGFCANAQSWQHIYNQEDTYKYIHTAIKKALKALGYNSNFAQVTSQKQTLCVQTLYTDDLMYNGKKILGSCMRRRGKKILVQGSVHLQLEDAAIEKFAAEFAKNLAEILDTNFKEIKLTDAHLQKAKAIAEEKYLNDSWNKKF